MSEEKSSARQGLSEARKRANKKYLDKFVEVKVRMTPDKRTELQAHAASMGESVTGFVTRAIAEAMERDIKNKK